MDKAEIQKVIDSLGLSVESVFVPFSQSRHKDGSWKCLNWNVTILRNGKAVFTFAYSAGTGSCPSSGKKMPSGYDASPKTWPSAAIDYEIESGYPARFYSWSRGFRGDTTKPIKPDSLNVFYSVVMDSSVLDYRNFEDWGPEMGFDADSRKGEKIYRECLEQTLALRSMIGEKGIEEMREAFQDY